ncbi:hypothetical protein [Roseburia sp. AM23-20]|uniref:hypothetical protein n=1 Tax=Roseburia sp. AM23-20 TaxID=2292066 RepID=UPI0011C3667B|nr:hypothetical protein [Roseburia sp. AM23-20]
MKEKYNDLIDIISYIGWSISVWLLVYFQLNMNTIDDTYRLVVWMFVFFGCLFYKDSYKEVTKEIIKSGVILIGTNILELYLVGDISGIKIFKLVLAQVLYQILAYLFVFFIRKSKEFHGRYTDRLVVLYLLVLGFLLFVIKLEIICALICTSIISLIRGYFYYKRCCLEKRRQKELEDHLEREHKEKENEMIKMRKKIEDYDELVKKNKKLEAKIRIRENKKRRKKH